MACHKTFITSTVAYACPAWEFAADTHLMKLQRLQNKALRTAGNFPRLTTVRDLHMAFKLSCIRVYRASNNQKSFEIMKMNMFAEQDKAKADRENISGLNLAAIKLTTAQVTKLPL
jgi:hypothetical protein